MIRGESDRFWERVGAGETSREIRWLVTDSKQCLYFAASAILGNKGTVVTKQEMGWAHSWNLGTADIFETNLIWMEL